MDILLKYPAVKEEFEKLSRTRCSEILDSMLKTDNRYKELIQRRSSASMALKNILDGFEPNKLFEEYSDSIYAQEIYELDFIYEQAFTDAVIVFQEQKIL